jgi:hypothetical protein
LRAEYEKEMEEIALARPYEAKGSGVGQVISFHIKPERNTSHDSIGGRIDDGPLRADHHRRFLLYWAALAS